MEEYVFYGAGDAGNGNRREERAFAGKAVQTVPAGYLTAANRFKDSLITSMLQ